MTSGTTVRPHYRLEAWKQAMGLVQAVYEVSAVFPRSELYGLTAQMRRAAVSVPSNLAEGAARRGAKEYSQYLNVARGSLSELETQLLIAANLGYLERKNGIFELLETVSRLITGLHRKILRDC